MPVALFQPGLGIDLSTLYSSDYEPGTMIRVRRPVYVIFDEKRVTRRICAGLSLPV
jgi:hypothetical protein